MAGSMFTGQSFPLSIHVESQKLFVKGSTFSARAYPYVLRRPFVGRPEVKHISTEAWVDFARGLLPHQEADQMKHHLEGCKKCRKAYDPHSVTRTVAIAAGSSIRGTLCMTRK